MDGSIIFIWNFESKYCKVICKYKIPGDQKPSFSSHRFSRSNAEKNEEPEMLIQEVKEKNWHLFVILYEFYQVDFYS